MDIEITSNPMTVTLSDADQHRLVLSEGGNAEKQMRGTKIYKITVISGPIKFNTIGGINSDSSSIAADGVITVSALSLRNSIYCQAATTGSFRLEILY